MFHRECMIYYALVRHVSIHMLPSVIDVVLVFMHEVMVCVVDMVNH